MTAHPDHATYPGAAAVLDAAARTSLFAPSVFNTQPWRWRITGDSMELYADPARRLDVTDPDSLPPTPRRDAAEVITVEE
jgi:hypothetical protein